jgi:HD domain-containing protein
VKDYTTSRATRYLPQVAVATATVAVVPVAAVWWLRANGVVSSPWVCIVVAITLSLSASVLGSAYWKRRRGPGDLFFSELLLWGWLRRLRVERQLANAVGMLGLGRAAQPDDGADSIERKAQLLRQLAAALDAQDPYTDGHSRRVARHSAMVARRMGLSGEQVARIQAAAAVHDVGKLRVPAELLNKPDKLTSAEFEITKRHADGGAEIVACLGDPELTSIVRHHHERFDGTGYPSGLLGEQIPLGARIVAVADTFDAMTSVRPYRLATPHKQALDALLQVSGTQLDPGVVRAFIRCYSGNRAILVWTLLAVSPQRALASVRGNSVGPRNVSFGTIGSGTAAAAAIGAAAIAIPAGGGPARYDLSLSRQPLASLIAVAPAHASVSAAHRSGPTKRAIRRPRRGHAAHVASLPVLRHALISNRSAGARSGATGSSGGGSGGGVVQAGGGGKPTGGSGGKPIGRPDGKPIGGPGTKPTGVAPARPPDGSGGKPPAGSGGGGSGSGGGAAGTGGGGGAPGGSGGGSGNAGNPVGAAGNGGGGGGSGGGSGGPTSSGGGSGSGSGGGTSNGGGSGSGSGGSASSGGGSGTGSSGSASSGGGSGGGPGGGVGTNGGSGGGSGAGGSSDSSNGSGDGSGHGGSGGGSGDDESGGGGSDEGSGGSGAGGDALAMLSTH